MLPTAAGSATLNFDGGVSPSGGVADVLTAGSRAADLTGATIVAENKLAVLANQFENPEGHVSPSFVHDPSYSFIKPINQLPP